MMQPIQLPPRPAPKATTKVPKVFGIFGTVCYGAGAIFSIITVMLIGITHWTPPWFVIGVAFLYVFISMGIICLGRIESNRDAKFFIRALRKQSDENKRRMN